MTTLHDLLQAVRGSLADYRRLLSSKDDLKTLPDNLSTREYTRILKEIELNHLKALKATQVETLTSEFIPESTVTAEQLEQSPNCPYPQSHRYDQISSKQGKDDNGRPSWNGFSLSGNSFQRGVKKKKRSWFF
jgi:hypothetical protein